MDKALDKPWWALRLTYGLVPIVAGLDKFTNLLTDWKKYLSPVATRMVPVSRSNFMRATGVVEIAAGALVLNRRTSRIGAYLVSGWLAGISANLLTTRRYLDIAVRDLVIAIGAFAYARLTEARERAQASVPAEVPAEGIEPAEPREWTESPLYASSS